VKSPLVVLVLLLAACSSSAPKSAPTSTFAPTVTTAPGIVVPPAGSGGSGCTQADLAGPVLSMPAPRTVTAPVDLKPAEAYGARIEPTPDATPTLSGADAWQKLTSLEPVRGRSGALLFGRFRASIPFGPHGPQKLNLLAWVVRVRHLPYAYPPDQAQLGACSFRENAYFVIDATTGARVLDSY
jgi:hypothetical protein